MAVTIVMVHTRLLTDTHLVGIPSVSILRSRDENREKVPKEMKR